MLLSRQTFGVNSLSKGMFGVKVPIGVRMGTMQKSKGNTTQDVTHE
jgi:hypothetical protein